MHRSPSFIQRTLIYMCRLLTWLLFQFVFDAVTDVIIKNNLKDCGLFWTHWVIVSSTAMKTCMQLWKECSDSTKFNNHRVKLIYHLMEEKCFDEQQFKGTGNTCKTSTNELTIISVFYTTAYKINLLLCLSIKLSLNLENMNGLSNLYLVWFWCRLLLPLF